MQKPQLSIIIPAFNEEEALPGTLLSLLDQCYPDGRAVPAALYQIIIVDNNSTDETARVVQAFQERPGAPRIELIEERTKGHIPARISGYNLVLNDPARSTPYLASGDADVQFHPHWVASVLEHFVTGKADVLSYAGCFPLSFWQRVPRLVERYLDEIGTIFFDPPTIAWLGLTGRTFKFTEQIFMDFGRPVSDCCFALSREAYLQAGGYQREFLDEACTQEVYGEGWRLLFNLERQDATILYINDAFYNIDPRRLLKEPEKMLSFNSYREGMMSDLRRSGDDDYTRLNHFASVVDLRPIQEYIIEYYILLRCITRPWLITANPVYFSSIADQLSDDIQSWWGKNPNPRGQDVFAFGKVLRAKYFWSILESTPAQPVQNRSKPPVTM